MLTLSISNPAWTARSGERPHTIRLLRIVSILIVLLTLVYLLHLVSIGTAEAATTPMDMSGPCTGVPGPC